MKASFLLDLCLENGIDFFTGVPESQLKGLCDELYARFGVSGKNHLVAHNEGGAIGLCAGHYLSTGRPACCYMQNSGLGNAVNPLASLMDTKVYGLPCLLVIGWRGEPGVHDEPQHVRQGEITTGQLDLLEIPWEVLSPSDTEEEFPPRFGRLLDALSQGKCAALVVRKGALKSDARPDYANAFEMTREAVAERLRPVIPVLILTIAVHSSIVAAIDPAERVVQKDWIIPFAVDTADDMAWRIEGGSSLLPQTIVLNRDGVVVYNREGSVTPEVLATLYAQAALDQ